MIVFCVRGCLLNSVTKYASLFAAVIRRRWLLRKREQVQGHIRPAPKVFELAEISPV